MTAPSRQAQLIARIAWTRFCRARAVFNSGNQSRTIATRAAFVPSAAYRGGCPRFSERARGSTSFVGTSEGEPPSALKGLGGVTVWGLCAEDGAPGALLDALGSGWLRAARG
jgi:hypothetical protein